MINEVIAIIKANPIAQGGLLTVAAGSIMGAFYKYSNFIWSFAKSKIFSEVQVLSNRQWDIYASINYWIDENKDKIRFTTFETLLRTNDVNNEGRIRRNKKGNVSNIGFTAGQGLHYFWYKRKLIFFYKERVAPTSGEYYETYTFSTYGINNKKIFHEFISECYELFLKENADKIYVCSPSAYEWEESKRPINRRPIESIILPDEIDIFEDVKFFLENKEHYINKGLMYKRCYFLHGVAGTGKSSIIKAIASEYGMNIYTTAINTFTETDSSKDKLMFSTPENSIIAIEDIHTFNFENTDNKQNISKFYNFLDGLNTPEDCIIFLTANDIENIPEALLRFGRVDKKYYFDFSKEKQVKAYIDMFAKDMFDAKDIDTIKNSINYENNLTLSKIRAAFLSHEKNGIQAIIQDINSK